MIPIVTKDQWFHPDGFAIVIRRQEPQEALAPHVHDFSELVIVTGGRGMHQTEHESWPLVAGDVFVVGGTQQPHGYFDTEDLHLCNILFDPRLLRMDEWNLGSLPGYCALFTLEPQWRRRHRFRSRLRLTGRDLAAAEAIINRMEDELERRDPGFDFIATAAFMHLVGFLSRRYGQSANPDTQALLRIAEAITYLEQHFNEPVNLDKLARIAHMSQRNFLREFRKAMGTSPIDYLMQVRINRAAERLRHDDRSITQIAFDSGFDDSNYFSRQFRQRVGVSPSVFRRTNASAAPRNAREV